MVLVKGNTTSAVLSMLSSTLGLTGETICSLGLGQARQSTLQSYTQPAKHSPSTRPVFPPSACIRPCHLGKMGPFHMQLLCTWSPLCFWRRSGCWPSATTETLAGPPGPGIIVTSGSPHLGALVLRLLPCPGHLTPMVAMLCSLGFHLRHSGDLQ